MYKKPCQRPNSSIPASLHRQMWNSQKVYFGDRFGDHFGEYLGDDVWSVCLKISEVEVALRRWLRRWIERWSPKWSPKWFPKWSPKFNLHHQASVLFSGSNRSWDMSLSIGQPSLGLCLISIIFTCPGQSDNIVFRILNHTSPWCVHNSCRDIRVGLGACTRLC